MTNEKSKRTLLEHIASDSFLGTLIALLTILTAVVAYHATQLETDSDDLEVGALQMLTESNTEYVAANQDINLDYVFYKDYALSDDPEVRAFFEDELLSDPLVEGLAREDGPFDDTYFDIQLEFALSTYAEAYELFDAADILEQQARQMHLIMLLFAVGLSFVGWASLLDEDRIQMRLTFIGLSLVAALGGGIFYGTLIFSV